MLIVIRLESCPTINLLNAARKEARIMNAHHLQVRNATFAVLKPSLIISTLRRSTATWKVRVRTR